MEQSSTQRLLEEAVAGGGPPALVARRQPIRELVVTLSAGALGLAEQRTHQPVSSLRMVEAESASARQRLALAEVRSLVGPLAPQLELAEPYELVALLSSAVVVVDTEDSATAHLAPTEAPAGPLDKGQQPAEQLELRPLELEPMAEPVEIPPMRSSVVAVAVAAVALASAPLAQA